MKNPFMFKPHATPNKAQGLPSSSVLPNPGANPLSAQGRANHQLAGLEQSGLPWMASMFGPMPVPAGGLPPVPGGGGGGGGGSTRMGPPRERRKIMRLGPRTAEEYYAENPGLPPATAPGSQTPATVPVGDPQNAPEGYLPMEALAWDDDQGRVPKPQMMAKGGKMPKGKPVLVGEEGPELILPREDGSGFVLPADVTQDVLPMMMKDVTPRKNGGKIAYRAEGGAVPYEVLQSPSGAFRGVAGEYGSGFASARPLPGQGNRMTAPAAVTPFMADPSGRYQLDRTAPGLPMLPDMEGMGEWAEPGLPVTPEMINANRAQIGGRLNVLRQTGGSPEDFMMVTDQATGEQIPQSEMLQRVSMRGQELAGEIGARREAADRARLAALPPIGTRPPGIDPAQRRMDRQMERFMRTPEGMMFSMKQGQQGQLAEQRAQLAATAIPVTDPATGQVMGWTNGLGASLPNPDRSINKRVHAQREVNGVLMNFFSDGTSEPAAPDVGIATPPLAAIDPMGKLVQLPANIDPASLPSGWTILQNRPTDGIGGATTEPSPGSQTPATGAATSAPMTITSKEQYDQLPKGAKYLWNGQELTKR